MRVPSKKQSSRKHNAHRRGLSGNPQRRAEQLRRSRVSAGLEPPSPEDRAQFRELAYRLAGGAHPEPWWQETHGHILARARALTWPSRVVDVETRVCELVGDVFFDRLNSTEGSVNSQWLRALAEAAGAALRADLADGAGSWEQLWALLRGLALTTPHVFAASEDEAVWQVRAQFPDIKDPSEVSRAEAVQAAGLLADRGLTAGSGLAAGSEDPVAGCRPAGEPLLARDAYGSRFLLAAPFAYDEGEPDHWYAWDVDTCWVSHVVGAGAFGTAEDALAEWSDAVGPAASGAGLSPCPAGLSAVLLAPCLAVGPLAEILTGYEPRELVREYYRMRRRAQVLTVPADDEAGLAQSGTDDVQGAFLDWYAARHEGVPEAVTAAAGTLASEWGLYNGADRRSFYSCSPHRIEMTAELIRAEHDADCADPVVGLLPEWTQWCLAQNGVDGDLAARSIAAANSAAAVPAGEPGSGRGAGSFRRQE
jgi:hypothetical protein